MKRSGFRFVALILAASWLSCHAGLAECFKGSFDCCGQQACEISSDHCGLMLGQAANPSIDPPALSGGQTIQPPMGAGLSYVQPIEGRAQSSSINIRTHPPTGPPLD